jgi:hypothetical protein
MIQDSYTACIQQRANIKKKVDALFRTETGALLWKSLAEWRGQMEHSSRILTELTALMGSIYAPKTPPKTSPEEFTLRIENTDQSTGLTARLVKEALDTINDWIDSRHSVVIPRVENLRM